MIKNSDIFSKWLDKNLSDDLPTDVIAVNFNIYEGTDPTYHIQLIGADKYYVDDDDWVCGEIYSTKEELCYIPRTDAIKDWEDGLEAVKALVLNYLKVGKYSSKLKKYNVVAVGFVDGDIHTLYRSE